MIKSNDRISPYQLAMIVIMAVIGAGAFHFINDAVMAGGNNSWLILILYGFVNIAAAWILITLSKRFPEKSFPEYIQEIIGVIPGKIVTIIFVGYLLIIISFEIREFTEVAKMFLLPRTPTEIIMLTLILTCVYVVRGGVECVSRVVEVLFPLLFIPFFLILLPGIGTVDLTNIFPVFRHMGSGTVKMLPQMPHAFRGTELLLFYIGFMKKPQKAYKPVTIGLMFVTFFYAVIILLSMGMFGVKGTTREIWPLISYIRNIQSPGLFMERLEGVALSLWVMTVYSTIVLGYFASSYSISKVVGTKEHRQYVLPLVIVIFYIALQPAGLAQLYDWGNLMYKYISSIFIYVLPLILLAIAALRKRGIKDYEKA